MGEYSEAGKSALNILFPESDNFRVIRGGFCQPATSAVANLRFSEPPTLTAAASILIQDSSLTLLCTLTECSDDQVS